MKCYSLFLMILFLSFISSFGKIQEIEYNQKIVSKYDKSFTFFSIKLNRETGVLVQYQKGKVKYEIDPETLSLVDKTGTEGLKSFELTNDELGLKPNKELFKNFDKIEFPEKTDFTNSLYPDFPIWHLIVDGKDYKSNVNTEFYDSFNELVNIKEIKEYAVQQYNN